MCREHPCVLRTRAFGRCAISRRRGGHPVVRHPSDSPTREIASHTVGRIAYNLHDNYDGGLLTDEQRRNRGGDMSRGDLVPRRRWRLAPILVVALMALAGCGSSSSSSSSSAG